MSASARTSFLPREREEIQAVIASQRVGAKRRPMTGSAKQSMQQQGRMDCFAALAMTKNKNKGEI
jgi:hypothetical protein